MKYWWKPYEALMESKAVPAIDIVVQLIAREAAEMCLHFPPPANQIDWVDPRLQKRIGGRLDELPKVNTQMVDVIAKLLTWDLSHEIDAIDHYFRNEKYADVIDSDDKLTAIHFLWRGIMEMFSQRKEEAKRALKARHLIEAAGLITQEYERLKRQLH